jgi:hypothetical protein
VVALVSPARSSIASSSRDRGWVAAAGIVLVLGLSLRLIAHGGGVGDRSAAIAATLLCAAAWLATVLLSTPRTAFVITLTLVALFDIAALPARNVPEYDDRVAFYRTDQVLSVQLPVVPGSSMLTVLAEPVFQSTASQPSFGLAGEVNGVSQSWDCPFRHGIQRLALPLPAATLNGGSVLDVQLGLSGSPSRDGDYLLVYESAQRGGFLVSLASPADAGQPNTTLCAAR